MEKKVMEKKASKPNMELYSVKALQQTVKILEELEYSSILAHEAYDAVLEGKKAYHDFMKSGDVDDSEVIENHCRATANLLGLTTWFEKRVYIDDFSSVLKAATKSIEALSLQAELVKEA